MTASGKNAQTPEPWSPGREQLPTDAAGRITVSARLAGYGVFQIPDPQECPRRLPAIDAKPK
jgi:hypothetical protein